MEPHRVAVELPLRGQRQQLRQRQPALEAGQRRAEAEVDPVAEGQLAFDPAADVEGVGV